ncbi:MAG TPA: ankyrin repeat domain-containing protein [Verrucomicrobiae bacterium]
MQTENYLNEITDGFHTDTTAKHSLQKTHPEVLLDFVQKKIQTLANAADLRRALIALAFSSKAGDDRDYLLFLADLYRRGDDSRLPVFQIFQEAADLLQSHVSETAVTLLRAFHKSGVFRENGFVAPDDLKTILKRGDAIALRRWAHSFGNSNYRTQSGDTPLHLAAVTGNTQFAKDLLRAGHQPHVMNASGETAAAVAQKHSHVEIAKLLADAAKAAS